MRAKTIGDKTWEKLQLRQEWAEESKVEAGLSGAGPRSRWGRKEKHLLERTVSNQTAEGGKPPGHTSAAEKKKRPKRANEAIMRLGISNLT